MSEPTLHVDLPSGAWAELIHVHDLSERRRNKFQMIASKGSSPFVRQQAEIALAQIEASGATPELIAVVELASVPDEDKLNTDRALVECMVESWGGGTLDGEAVPRHNGEWLDAITGRDYDVLILACLPAIKQMFLDTTPTTEDGAPFGPSNASVQRSVDVAVAQLQTQLPKPGGASTPSSESPAGPSPISTPPPDMSSTSSSPSTP